MKVFKEFEIVGEYEKINSFFDAVTAEMDKTVWKRQEDIDDESSGLRGKFVQFLRYKDETKGIPDNSMICFYFEANTAKITNIVPETVGELGIEVYNIILNEFIDFIKPYLSEFDLKSSESHEEIDLKDILDQSTFKYLSSFSSLANKSTGSSHPLDFNRWVKFLIFLHKSNKYLDMELLERWLTDNGWGERQTYRLIREVEFSLELLKKYDEMNNG